MRHIWTIIGLTLVAMIAWAALVTADAYFGWTRAPLAPRDDSQAFFAAAVERLESENRGNAVFILIEQGLIVDAYARSNGTPVTAESFFQVASLSKWLTAWGVMTLVEQGKLDLDAPVSTYLTRWQLPDGPYNDQVTIRRLLSHTAGLNDRLGYGGFEPGAPIQTLEESLTQASDAAFGANGAVHVGAEPGSEWNYSGGGYTLLQLVIEEVTGEAFNDYMKRTVFAPLGMRRSTYVLTEDDRPFVAEFYDQNGEPAIHYTFTATAAASLYTSANDLARFLQAHTTGFAGEPPGRGVLRPETLAAMREPEAELFGLPFWGLGVVLYAADDAGSYIIGHDGGNLPAINTTARFDPATGDGIVVLVTGNQGLASRIGGEWTYWKVGAVDLFSLRSARRTIFSRTAIGWAIILALALLFAWRTGRRTKVADLSSA